MLTQEQIRRFTEKINFNREKIEALINLLNQGYHLEYIYQYRRDEIGIDNWNFLVHIVDKYRKFLDIESKKSTTLHQLEKNGLLTDDIKSLIEKTTDSALLDDLILPLKKKSKGRSQKPIQQGLQELANFIWQQLPVNQPLEITAESFVNPTKMVSTPEEALAGAVTILSEQIEQDYHARKTVKEFFWKKGILVSTSTKTAQNQKTQFEQFYNHSEPIRKISAVRFLQILKGMRLGFLKVSIEVDENEAIEELLKVYVKERGSIFEPYIRLSIQDAYRKQLKTVCENRVFIELKEDIESQFLNEMRDDLKNILMFPPANLEVLLSIVPGIEEEWAVCVVDRDGHLLEGVEIFPMPPQNEVEQAKEIIRGFIDRYRIRHIVIGNGAGVEDAFQFIGEIASQYSNPRVRFVTYEQRYARSFARSKFGEAEFPNYSEKIREAYYLAKYFNSPLKELIKLPYVNLPEGILHKEINERRFNSVTNQIIDHCINTIGVDVNQADVNELKHIAGIRTEVAQNIVETRNSKGGFKNRKELLEIAGINEHTFNQCAGFLYVRNGDNPLDRTRIHPNWYETIESCTKELNIDIPNLFRSFKNVKALVRLLEERKLLGKHAIKVIIKELKSPGHDPRGNFVFPRYMEGIYKVSDLKAGMQTEGIIKKILSNLIVVDIGIQIDAVIHIRNNPAINRVMKRKLFTKRIGDFIKVNIESIDFDNKKVHLIPYFPERVENKKEFIREKGRKEIVSSRPSDTGEKHVAEFDKQRGDRFRKQTKPSKFEGERETKKGTPVREDQLVNTQLAEQLAALKNKLQQ